MLCLYIGIYAYIVPVCGETGQVGRPAAVLLAACVAALWLLD